MKKNKLIKWQRVKDLSKKITKFVQVMTERKK